MRIADLPAADRPRERLSAVGAQHLADRELLAMVLGTGTRGQGAHVLAERLLARYGSVLDLAKAHPADLLGVPGVGLAKASAVVAAFELARRAERPTDTTVLSSTADLRRVVSPLLVGRSRERLVLVAVLRRDGEAFALAHNHPGNNPTPSESDIEATLRLRGLAPAMGLRFLEHLVLTDTSWCSIPMPEDADD